MEDRMDITRRVGSENIVIEGNKGWTVHRQSGTLVEIDFITRKAKILCHLGFDSNNCAPQYGVAEKIGNYVYLFPCYQKTYPARIAYYDLNKNILNTIELPADKYSVNYVDWRKCGAGGVVNNDVFITGMTFPGIVRISGLEKNISVNNAYIKEMIEMSGKDDRWHFFAEGMVSDEKFLYFASGMSSAILKVNPSDNSSELIRLSTSVQGFNRILKLDDEKCFLVGYGESSNCFIVWNYKRNEIMSSGSLEKYHGGESFSINPLFYDNNVFMFPQLFYKSMDYSVYKFNIDDFHLEELDGINWLKKTSYNSDYSLMSTCVGLVNNKMFFVTTEDLCWNVFDGAFKNVEELTISISDDQIYDSTIRKKIEYCKDNGIPINENEISLSYFCELIR